MNRPQNWPALLSGFIEEKRNQPFKWGENDCCLFASDWCAILTGNDPAADLRGTYGSALDAMRILKAGGGVEGVVSARCDARSWTEWPSVKQCRRGDVATVDTEHGPALGVCVGAQVAFTGPAGVAFVPVNKCRRAWRID